MSEVCTRTGAPHSYWPQGNCQYCGEISPVIAAKNAEIARLQEALELFVQSEKMARDGNPPQDADALIILGEAALHPTTPEKLGRFGHHPDPANDFCIEVEAIQGQFFDATHAISKPGTLPATVEEVYARVQKAMEFHVGADEIAVSAKHLLRGLEVEVKAFLLKEKSHA